MFRYQVSGVPRRGLAAKAGFTLIEVLVTVVILSVGIVMVLRALDTSVLALGETRSSLMASMVIKERATRVRLAGLRGGKSSLNAEEGRFTDAQGGFSGDLRLELIDTSMDGSNTLYQVKIEVWRAERDRRYSATTFICVANDPED